ncbi:YqzG/YhdC family protein [Bacillus timonensis]|nr:YqzG/YhdC family protein [Bacillus timonensis]
MKKLIITILLFHVMIPIAIEKHVSYAENPDNNWKELAITETKKRYPLGQILHIQQVWKINKDEDTSVERFKLKVRNGHNVFGVFVTITYDQHTNEVRNILIMEALY